MKEVLFPGLGLSFSLDNVAFEIFGTSIYWYGIIIGMGFLLGAGFCMKRAPQMGLTDNELLDMLIFAAPSAIIGARTYYVIFYLDMYRNSDGSYDFMKMLRIHDGGLAIYGGILAAVFVAILVCRYKKISFFAMADLCSFGLLIGQSIGRWGNFMNVEAYGGETTLPWRMGITETVNGVATYIEVHPTFLYESLWNALGFCLLLLLLKKGYRKFDGMLFFSYVAWYGFGRGLIEGLRTDSLYFFSTGLRVSQVLAFVSCILAVAYIAYRLHQKPREEDLYVNKMKNNSEE